MRVRFSTWVKNSRLWRLLTPRVDVRRRPQPPRGIPVRALSIGRGRYGALRANGRRVLLYRLYFRCPVCGKDQQPEIVGTARRVVPRAVQCRRCGAWVRPQLNREQRRWVRAARRWARGREAVMAA